MSTPNDDWSKMFGSIDVGMGGISSTPAKTLPAKQAPNPPPATNQIPVPPPLPQPAIPAANNAQQVAPGVFQMAASFGTSMAKFAAGGFRTTGKELHQRRLAVCDDCEHRSGTNCILCGCILPLKAKMPHETCPIGKWPG